MDKQVVNVVFFLLGQDAMLLNPRDGSSRDGLSLGGKADLERPVYCSFEHLGIGLMDRSHKATASMYTLQGIYASYSSSLYATSKLHITAWVAVGCAVML